MADYYEMQGSPEEEKSKEGFKATRRFICNWSDRIAVRDALLNTTYPTFISARAKRLSIVPYAARLEGSGSDASYEKAVVTAEYEFDKKEQIGTDLLTELLQPTLEFITLDPKNFRWGSVDGDALTKEQAPGLLMPGCEYIVTLFEQDRVTDEMLRYMGAVNTTAVSPRTQGLTGLVFPAQTLLYMPPVIRRTINTDEELQFEIELHFIYKPNWQGEDALGWNAYWRPEAQEYQFIYSTETEEKYEQYRSENLNALIPGV